MNKLKAFLPHFLISLLLVLVVLVILDEYNPAMGFLNSGVSKVYFGILFAVGMYVAIRLITENQRQ